MVGVLQEPGVDLHLPLEHRLELRRHLVPGRDLGMARCQLGVRADDAQLLLPRERLLAQRVPALGEAALVLVGPLLGDVVRGMHGTRREIDEERLVRRQRLLLVHPDDGAVGHVLGQVVALFGGGRRLDRGHALVERRVVLARLAADETVEVLEAPTTGRPRVERTHGRGLPGRDLVALAELGGRVPVQLQGERQRRLGVRAHRVVARCRRGDLGDGAHPDRVVIAAGQHRLPRGRAQGARVETGVLQPVRSELLGDRRRARSAERAGRTEPHVVQQDDEHVRRPGRRKHRLDRREPGLRVLGVVRRELRLADVGNGKDRTHVLVRLVCHVISWIRLACPAAMRRVLRRAVSEHSASGLGAEQRASPVLLRCGAGGGRRVARLGVGETSLRGPGAHGQRPSGGRPFETRSTPSTTNSTVITAPLCSTSRPALRTQGVLEGSRVLR